MWEWRLEGGYGEGEGDGGGSNLNFSFIQNFEEIDVMEWNGMEGVNMMEIMDWWW